MVDLTENKLFYRSLQVSYATLLFLVSECFPPLNDLFQLSQFPVATEHFGHAASSSILQELVWSSGFPAFFGVLMVLDTILVFGVERLLR